jgi:hypothetical protein
MFILQLFHANHTKQWQHKEVKNCQVIQQLNSSYFDAQHQRKLHFPYDWNYITAIKSCIIKLHKQVNNVTEPKFGLFQST